MTIHRFEEVKIKATRHWKDTAGRWRQETRTFMQTLNPFNKNAAGLVKNRIEIERELLAERQKWLDEPVPKK